MNSRAFAGIVALIGWAGLGLQFWLIVQNLGFAQGLWRFVGFFTILTNLGAAAVASAIALGQTRGLAGPLARMMAAISIILVGLIYSLALRSLWNPEGLQKLADIILHDAMPLLFTGLWLASPHGALRWRDLSWALLPPALYAAYALARGEADGWYAYWFLNPAEQSVASLASSVALLLLLFAVLSTVLIAVDRWLAPDEPLTT